MLEDVAMPYVEEFLPWSCGGSMRQIEALDDARDIARIGLDRVLARRPLVALRRHGLPGEDDLAGLLIRLDIEGLSIQYLKLHEVDV